MTLAVSRARDLKPVTDVSGWYLLATIAIGAVASAAVGTATYYAVHSLVPSTNSSVTTQFIVAEVYGALTLTLVLAFNPFWQPPIALRFTSIRDLGLALIAWVAIVASSLIVYLLLRPVAGSLPDCTRRILTVATDAKRLQGQPASAWAIAIPRGCLLVPLFEELLFRGLLLEWLRKRFTNSSAIVVSAVLFAAMHAYPIVMPYTFLSGLFTGWVRIKTGSTFNTLIMHVLNNVLFLYLGLFLLR
jgi:hypothetical protein